MRIEVAVLALECSVVPQHVPRVYHHDGPNAIIAMRYLQPPFAVLRGQIVEVRGRSPEARGLFCGDPLLRMHAPSSRVCTCRPKACQQHPA